VIWPSKKFDELVAASGVAGNAQGAAGLQAHDTQSDHAIEDKLEGMKEFFTEPEQRQILDEAKAMLPDLEEKGSARRAFVEKMRSLLDPAHAEKEDSSKAFFRDDGDELMTNLKIDEDDLDPEIANTGGSASLPLGVGGIGTETGGAAKFSDLLSGFKASALNVLNYTTYYEMKARAGEVGKNGVAKLIDGLPAQVQRIHLIGHSFGGRVVSAAAANSKTDRIKSLTLLQAAFSHNGFSRTEKGFFRPVVDQKRIDGPILITHTQNDKAVGIAYPLASRLNGDRAAALGDANDPFGGLGRNGAQKMEQSETVTGQLLAVGGNYTFQPRTFFNLEASSFIKSHGDVRGQQVAYALRRAIA
jgi:predicted alpha/beta hydrolase family esterase